MRFTPERLRLLGQLSRPAAKRRILTTPRSRGPSTTFGHRSLWLMNALIKGGALGQTDSELSREYLEERAARPFSFVATGRWTAEDARRMKEHNAFMSRAPLRRLKGISILEPSTFNYIESPITSFEQQVLERTKEPALCCKLLGPAKARA